MWAFPVKSTLGNMFLKMYNILIVEARVRHYMDIEDNKKKTKITRIVPGAIFVMMAIYVLFAIIPYIGSYALR